VRLTGVFKEFTRARKNLEARTIHDLRRTFIIIAESIDVRRPYAIKRMVNHKMRGDFAAGYIVADVERQREPVRRVSEFLQKALGLRDSATVRALRAAQAKKLSRLLAYRQ
jgi:hypothetical protein